MTPNEMAASEVDQGRRHPGAGLEHIRTAVMEEAPSRG